MVLGEKKKIYQKCLDCDFRLIWRPTKFLLWVVPKVGGGVPRLGHNPKFVCVFFCSDSSPDNLEVLQMWIILTNIKSLFSDLFLCRQMAANPGSKLRMF